MRKFVASKPHSWCGATFYKVRRGIDADYIQDTLFDAISSELFSYGQMPSGLTEEEGFGFILCTINIPQKGELRYIKWIRLETKQMYLIGYRTWVAIMEAVFEAIPVGPNDV